MMPAPRRVSVIVPVVFGRTLRVRVELKVSFNASVTVKRSANVPTAE